MDETEILEDITKKLTELENKNNEEIIGIIDKSHRKLVMIVERKFGKERDYINQLKSLKDMNIGPSVFFGGTSESKIYSQVKQDLIKKRDRYINLIETILDEFKLEEISTEFNDDNVSKERTENQNTQIIKKMSSKFIEILESAKDLEFEQIGKDKCKYILKNAPKLQKIMEDYGFGISDSTLQGFKDSKMIKNLQNIFSTKMFFDIYTKNDLGLAVYKKVIVEIENFLDEIEKNPAMIKKEVSPEIITEEIGRDVFIIHGRNLKIMNSMFEFLQNLDLHPIPFEEAKRKTKEGSPYNLNVLKKAITRDVTVLALITPDDIGFLNPFFHKKEDSENEKRLMGQARSNVIFETGFALATNPTRTILVVFGNVRKYSDIAGINYFNFVDTHQKRNELKELLRSIGCPIQESPNYLDVGNFEIETEILKNIPNSPNYSSTKSEIINSVKILRDLSIKIVRNEYNNEIDEKFKSQLSFIHKFPEVEAILPNYLSQESESVYLHKSFKNKGGYDDRVIIINSDFDIILKHLKTMNF